MGDQTAWINKDESKIIAAFESALKSREANGLHSGIVTNLYQFDYGGSGSIWCRGETYPITNPLSPFDTTRGNRVSIFIRDAAEECQMRDLVRDLFPLKDNVLLKPIFAAYNIKLQKTVVCCMPITDNFTNWISKQTQVLPDGYLHLEAKNMIRSVLSLSGALWIQGYVCDGLNDPQNYGMMDAHVRVLPFTIRKKRKSDSKMYHRFQFADLLENHFNTIWNDVDVEEFIKCLRDHELRASHLYLNLWREKFSLELKQKYSSISSYSNWVNSVSPDDEVLQGILTHNHKNSQNTSPKYQNTSLDAHKFARDTCSHYLKKWRSTIPSNIRPKSSYDMVDKVLKRLFPGLLSKVYAFSCQCDWILK